MIDTSPEPLGERENIVRHGIMLAQHQCHVTSVNAGWYHDPQTGQMIERNDGEMIALMHSELSEGLEAIRKDLADDKLPDRPGIEVELADLLIRVFDYAEYRGLDLAGAVIEKNRFNRNRADHKLESRRAAGGKKF